MIRRYGPMKQSMGTVIPYPMRVRVKSRDGGCVGYGRLPGNCYGGIELDHVRASGGVSMKSVTCDCNLVSLCGGHHRFKTDHGKIARPILLTYLERFDYGLHPDGHAVLSS